jgi:hypothetical protein
MALLLPSNTLTHPARSQPPCSPNPALITHPTSSRQSSAPQQAQIWWRSAHLPSKMWACQQPSHMHAAIAGRCRFCSRQAPACCITLSSCPCAAAATAPLLTTVIPGTHSRWSRWFTHQPLPQFPCCCPKLQLPPAAQQQQSTQGSPVQP